MTKAKVLAMLIGVALLFILPATVSAQRVPPHVFVGTAKIDGVAAPNGATVTAWVDGAQVASTTVTGGSYSISVDQGDASFAGKKVSFKVGGNDVAQSATWSFGGGDELNLTATAAPVVVAPVGPATVGAAVLGVNLVLADSTGRTLYLFTRDTQGKTGTPAKSACTSAGCLALWPLLISVGAPVAGSGVDAAKLGTAKHANDANQVTYNGWPLYYYTPDKAPGDAKGQGVGGVWWVVSPAGDGITGAGSPGPAGSAGAAGRAGVKGDKGDTGAKGDKGDKGDRGVAGTVGATGAKGDKGDSGAAGARGAAGAAGGAGPAGAVGGAGAAGDDASNVIGIIAIIIAAVAIVAWIAAFLMMRKKGASAS